MRTSQLVAALEKYGRHADPVLITINSGPYRSPGKIVPLTGTDDVIIEADYPRNGTTVESMLIAIRDFPPEGTAQVYVAGQESWCGYYDITQIRAHERGIVIIADLWRAEAP